ncbi:MAG TPA: DEAD/DEAH box helicase [Verrucomicrobiota bacterium]|nr:serine/threonine protein phosphatase [Verrucomicrobiales bacterium]HRI14943.1 DEAD/DEAH box helicase [Verrucomicrobiota bacterium]
MPRGSRSTRPATRPVVASTKYDAHHKVLSTTYGSFADLRRELADSKEKVAEREAVLKLLGSCPDPQRAYLLFDDYLEKLSLRRSDFGATDWWSRIQTTQGRPRLEEVAMLFLRANRSLPTELMPFANFERFQAVEQSEKETQFVQELENWLLPSTHTHLDAPKAALRIICEPRRVNEHLNQWRLALKFLLFRSRSGEKERFLSDLCELRTRAAHEAELFPADDWAVIDWLHGNWGSRAAEGEMLILDGADLLTWLATWAHGTRLELAGQATSLQFHGQIAELKPHLDTIESELSFTHLLALPDGQVRPLSECKFFVGQPVLVLVENEFFILRNAPPVSLLGPWAQRPVLPVKKLSHRLLTELRKSQTSRPHHSAENGGNGNHAKKERAAAATEADWTQLCITHSAKPRFVFELADEVVRLRLLCVSERDHTEWQWNGHEWARISTVKNGQADRPEVIDDARIQAAIQWLQQLDWFTPEPGLWVGDANEMFLSALATTWPDKPPDAEYLGNPAFQRLFLNRRLVKPKLVLKGSGIDWLSVSAEWEAEGMRLSSADLQRLAAATTRFVKLPDGGWVELDVDANRKANETAASLGLEGLSADAQKASLLHATQLDDATLTELGSEKAVAQLRDKLANFKGVPDTKLPETIKAELRPYQKEGFNFLANMSRLKLGGILADDMGLGKTLQTLAWLTWLHDQHKKDPKPTLVLCPASVLHNWRREAERFTPHFKVLVLQSGQARHNLRKQIPEHDIVVTNYAILRRDLEELAKFEFRSLVLDEAQFIKNPNAQVTLAVKEIESGQRLALTGTPLENRLLDLWSIVDFIQPGYLGSQTHFHETYEPKGDGPDWEPGTARRRLSARLRPLMLRRLKKQVAKDLPDRIEERRDCELDEEQRKLYLAELRRSREQVMKALQEKGVAKSKMHVLAALTRLRQICCHPKLVGNDSASGKTDTLFELLEPILQSGNKVLLFSQFVEMLKLLEAACKERGIKTHMLTGETKARQDVVNAFQAEDDACVFLLSLRAAGTGLNLTTASYVVLYDPWWNPAVEAQAIDRSHRIGQTRTVNAYRLIAPGTVEEKIWELQQKKSQTISDVLGEEGFATNLTKDDLEYLFSED